VQGGKQEACRSLPGLFQVTSPDTFAYFEQLQGLFLLANQQVAEMAAESVDKVASVKAPGEYFVEEEQAARHVFPDQHFGQTEVIVVIENVQVVDHRTVAKLTAGEGNDLIEHGQRIAQGPVGFLGDQVQPVHFVGNPLASGDIGQMLRDVLYPDAVEIKYLAAG